MPARQVVVIVGGGLAGAKAAEALRSQGFDGRIVLIGEEETAPTSARRCPRTTCRARPTGKRLRAPRGLVRRARRRAAARHGRHRDRPRPPRGDRCPAASSSGYDKLLLATGSLAAPPAGARRGPGRRALPAPRSATATGSATRSPPRPGSLIVGAGWIGLEVAAAAAAAGRRGDRRGGRRAAAAARARPARWRRSSPTCTASTGSTCGSACRSPRSPAAAGRRPGCGWPTAPGSPPTR